MASAFTRRFNRFAKWTGRVTGRPAVFFAAVAMIAAWLCVGPLLDDTWQLTMNTAATTVTLLMVFLIQNTQSRSSTALQIKLDELIRSVEGAHNALLTLEELDERELQGVRAAYERLADHARERVRRGAQDTDVPEVRHAPPAKT